ncbi:MAG TPA: hypothetical protein VNF47_26565 [Streptosporangiaceae bacterium]|nr:hypothetical protein [Streptosporangiaceae bacterium]
MIPATEQTGASGEDGGPGAVMTGVIARCPGEMAGQARIPALEAGSALLPGPAGTGAAMLAGQEPGGHHGGGSAPDLRRSGAYRERRAPKSWPLILLAVPATVAVWSGWVQLGQMTGFGLVRPFPGLWDSFEVNTAITLPIGVEAYGAFALGTWLSSGTRTSARTRRYAMWSAIGSLLLGMAGQVAYHLMSQAHMARAPWAITTGVACLPVLLLGMAAALAHMRHADAHQEDHDDARHQAPAATIRPTGSGPGRDLTEQGTPAPGQPCPPGDTTPPAGTPSDEADCVETKRLEVARVTALQLVSTGVRVSRRTLRDAGLRGSNAELGALVKAVSAELDRDDDDQQEPGPCPPRGRARGTGAMPAHVPHDNREPI